MNLAPAKHESIHTDHVELVDGKVPLSDFTIYKGYLTDEPAGSQVTGTIIDGIFIGTISSKKHGQFFIESAKRYPNDKSSDSEDDHHAVIYHESDINTPQQVKEAKRKLGKITNEETVTDDDLNGEIGCGYTHKKTREQLKREQEKITTAHLRKKRVRLSF